MAAALTFLIVEDNDENRFLLVRTLARKYPGAQCIECSDSEAAVAAVAQQSIATAIVHRAADEDGIPVIRLLRQASASLPIVMVSGMDRRTAARTAGATSFLCYDEWLLLGNAVADAMKTSGRAGPESTPPGNSGAT